MKILVGVKGLAPRDVQDFPCHGSGSVGEDTQPVLSPYEEYALEQALGLRDLHPDIKITALTVGPESASAVLRRCLSQTVDKAIHVLVENGTDSFQNARLIADAVQQEFDLLLFGYMAVDDMAGMVGPLVAHHLGVPQVTGANAVELFVGDRIRVRRRIEGRLEILEAGLPAVVTVARGERELRYPRQQDRLHVSDSLIRRVIPGQSEIPESQFMVCATTGPKPLKKQKLDWFGLSATEKVNRVMRGGVAVKKTGKPVEGSSRELVGKILDFLTGNKFI